MGDDKPWRDEIRVDPELSPMVKRVMESFWKRLDEIDGEKMPRQSLNDDDQYENLGPCCLCKAKEGARNVLLLTRLAPVPGTGWGCVVCGLPSNGAVAVLCDQCLARKVDPKFVCNGYARGKRRFAFDKLAPEKFDHDMSKHEPGD